MNTKVYNQGFTLIEVLVALGVSFILIVGLVTMMVNTNKQADIVRNKIYLQDVENQIREIMRDPARCQFNFSGASDSFNATGINSASASNPTRTNLINKTSIINGDLGPKNWST